MILADSPTHLVSAEEAEAILQPYLDRLNECIQHGWNAWQSDYQSKHRILGSRARAAIVYDEIVAKAMELFEGQPDTHFERTSSSFLLYFGDKLIVRFKKIRKDGRSSNVPTRQQNLFNLQIELPGMESGTIVHAGYELDQIQQDIKKKAVVCQYRGSVLWTIGLSGGAELIAVPSPTPPPVLPSRVEIKPEFAPQVEKKEHGSN